MNKIKLIIMITILFILGGCVSITLGDKTYEISENGFSVTSNNENNYENNQVFSNDNIINIEENDEVTQDDITSVDIITNNNNDENSNEDDIFVRIFDNDFPDDIYFPEDANIFNTFDFEGDNQRDMTVEYDVEGDRQTELIDIYRDYALEKKMKIFIDGLDPESEGEQISAMIKDGPSFMANVKIEDGYSIVKIKYIKRW